MNYHRCFYLFFGTIYETALLKANYEVIRTTASRSFVFRCLSKW